MDKMSHVTDLKISHYQVVWEKRFALKNKWENADSVIPKIVITANMYWTVGINLLSPLQQLPEVTVTAPLPFTVIETLFFFIGNRLPYLQKYIAYYVCVLKKLS